VLKLAEQDCQPQNPNPQGGKSERVEFFDGHFVTSQALTLAW